MNILKKYLNRRRPSTPPGRAARPWLAYLVVWLLACGIGGWLRLYPLWHTASHDASEKASLMVMARLRQSVTQSVNAAAPQLPQPERDRLIKERFDQILRADKKKVLQAIATLSQTLDQDAPPRRHDLLASDSFYYYDLTRTILDTGRISDQIKGSKYLNRKMNAPLGYWEPLNLHPYVGAMIHRAASWFHPGIPLTLSVSATPLLLMALTLIPFVVLCSLWGCGPLTTLTGALYLLGAPIYLQRSMFGWYDNDPYNIFFPLLILTVLLVAFRQPRGRRFLLLAGITAALVPVYALFWQGWMLLESILLGSTLISLIAYGIAARRSPRTVQLGQFFIILLLGSFAGIGLIFGFPEFFTLFKEGIAAVLAFGQKNFSLWPDLYIAVGELRRATPQEIFSLTGGAAFAVLTVWGLGVTIYRVAKTRDLPAYTGILLLVFLGGTLLLAAGAKRFILLSLVPASLLAALGLNGLARGIRSVITRLPGSARLIKILSSVIPVLALIILGAVPVYTARTQTPTLLDQIYNDTWNEALTTIAQKTPPDSIINTWWSPGHFIKAIGNRRVTFDGASINSPQSYWLARALMSDDETAALGFLRMLNNSANQAVDALLARGMRLSEAIDLLSTITPISRTAARTVLGGLSLPPGFIDQLLDLTHRRPPPTYLFITNELVEANLLLNYVANWDFKKAEAIRASPQRLAQIPPRRSKAYVNFLWDLAGGYPRYSGPLNPVSVSDKGILFEGNIWIDPAAKTCRIRSPQYGVGVPVSLIYEQDGQVIEKTFPNASLSYSVLLIQDQDRARCALMDQRIARSLIMRLFFFNGAGLKNIHPFTEAADLTERTLIRVFSVDWDGFERSLTR